MNVQARNDIGSGFDTVLHLTFETRDQASRPFVRVVKSVGNDYVHEPLSIEWRRV